MADNAFLRGWNQSEVLGNQRGAHQLAALSGLLNLQAGMAQQQENAMMNPLRRRLLEAQVNQATNPAPTRVDLGDRIGFVDGSGNLVGFIPKGATPDAALREQGATTRHQTPSGTALYGGQVTMRGQDMTDARTREEGAANRSVTLAGINRPQFSEAAGAWLLPPAVGGVSGAPRFPQPQADQGYSPSVRGAFGMQIPPQVQAQRDAEAARIRAGEANGGAGMIPTSTVIPVPGMTPKPRQTAGQNAADQAFAKEYVDFKAAGGFADIEKNLRQLSGASQSLATDSSLTGPLRGMLPDTVRTFTNPNAVATKELVQEVAQRNLRLILGAQFTEKEGERLIARVYNDRLSPEENKRRVDALMTQIREAAQAKQSASEYFEQNGTLTGWQGKLPKLDDFMPKDRASDSSSGWSIRPVQ